MTCIHGFGSSVVRYVISDIPLYDKMITLDILNEHEPNSDHRPLLVNLNLVIDRDPIEENSHSYKHLIFDRNKGDIFLNDLKNDVFPLSRIDNIDDIYHNFTTVLSSSINKFSIEVLGKMENRRTNPWYDEECNSARSKINKAMEGPLKIDKIKRYKSLIKMKKMR